METQRMQTNNNPPALATSGRFALKSNSPAITEARCVLPSATPANKSAPTASVITMPLTVRARSTDRSFSISVPILLWRRHEIRFRIHASVLYFGRKQSSLEPDRAARPQGRSNSAASPARKDATAVPFGVSNPKNLSSNRSVGDRFFSLTPQRLQLRFRQ